MIIMYNFFEVFINIWLSGGVLMWPLLVMAIFIYWSVFDILCSLSEINFFDIAALKKEPADRLNIDDLNRVFDKISDDIISNNIDEEIHYNRVAFFKAHFIPYIDRRIVFLRILTTVAPLLGLLGTVMGMLTTFSEMGQHQASSVDAMAGGISEALITTQTGLIIAVPALFMIMLIQIKRNKLANFLEQIENTFNRYFYRQEAMEIAL